MTYQSEVTADSPLLYYRLDATTGTAETDLGSGAHNGTYIGGFTLNQASLLTTGGGTSVAFDGTTSTGVRVGSGYQLPTGDTFTIEFWLRPADLANEQYIFAVSGTGQDSAQIRLNDTVAKRIQIRGLTPGHQIANSDFDLVVGTNYHVAWTKSGSTNHLYVNGVDHIGTTTNYTLASGSGGGDTYIAVGADGIGGALNGRLDEVAVYTTALSAARVLAHYNAGASAAVTAAPTAGSITTTRATPVVTVATGGAKLAIPTAAAIVLAGSTPVVTSTRTAIPTAAAIVTTRGTPTVTVTGGVGAPFLAIAGVDRTGVLKADSLRLNRTADGSQGTADLVLLNHTPADDAAVVITYNGVTLYSGHIRSRGIVEWKIGSWQCAVGCQDDATTGLPLGAAPWAFSDTPNNTTTFGYLSLALEYVSARGASYTDLETHGTVRTRRAGILPGHTLTITAADHGLAAVPFYVQQVQTDFPTNTPEYTITFGDPPLTLLDTINAQVDSAIEDAAVGLAAGLKHPDVFATLDDLPALPDPLYPIGALAYVTSTGKIYHNANGTWTNVVDGADILVASITAGAISAGAIGAQALAADIVLAGKIRTALDGPRVELDADGLRVYDTSSDIAINAPTEGAVYVKAQMEATDLLVTGDAVLRGTDNQLSASASLTVASYQGAPSQAPTLSHYWPPVSLPVVANDWSSQVYLRRGLCYDPAGGAGGSTHVVWTLGLGIDTANHIYLNYLHELKASDRTLNRQVFIGGYSLGTQAVSVCRMGTFVYVLFNDGRVRRYNAATLALDATYVSVSAPITPITSPQICSDGTNIYIADKIPTGPGLGSWSVRWNKYDAVMVKVGSTIDTGYDPGPYHVTGAYAGSADFGAFRLVVQLAADTGTHSFVQTFNSSGTRQGNEAFNTGEAGGGGVTYGDVEGLGARFYSMPNLAYPYSGVESSLNRHSTWTWTTASPLYWVAYSWLDNTQTVRESTVGPMSSITMSRRGYLSVGMASLPGSGGADDPTHHRVYVLPNATQPSTALLWRQDEASVPDATGVMSTYVPSTSHPVSTNGFAALGHPATIASQGGEWELSGDGTATFGTLYATKFGGAIQSGFIDIVLAAQSNKTGAVSFGTTFAAVPTISLTTDSAISRAFVPRVVTGSLTTSGFTATIVSVDSSTQTGTVRVYWTAALTTFDIPEPDPVWNWPSLQAAINGSAAGSTIDATGRTFNEHVFVTKSVTIVGATVNATGFSIPTLQGGIEIQADNVTLDTVRVTGSSGCGLYIRGYDNLTVIDSEFDHNRQAGYGGTGTDGVSFTNCHIHHNNEPQVSQPASDPNGPRLITAGPNSGKWWPIDPFWEAGGGKFTNSTNTTFDGCTVEYNGGPGIWFDISGNFATITDNIVHHNGLCGIMFEISTDATITGNNLWENGWDDQRNGGWAWGANILLTTCRNAVATGNISAWSYGGGMVVSQSRAGEWPYNNDQSGNSITNNTIAVSAGRSVTQYAQDWSNPVAQAVITPNTTVAAGSGVLTAAGVPANPEAGH